MDVSIRDHDTSSRGLTAGMPASSDSPARYSSNSGSSDENETDISKIPPHRRWANVPMRYAYRVENLQEGIPEDERWNWRTFFSYCGPGFLVAIAYLDPGNLEANLQVRLPSGSSLFLHINALAHIRREPTPNIR